MRNRIRVKQLTFGDEDGSAVIHLEVKLWPKQVKKEPLIWDPTQLLLAMSDYLDNVDGED